MDDSPSHSPLGALLNGRAPVIDGGYGWLLQERGLAPGECPESWNLTRPDAVRGLHAEYASAGATILTTNTFGATRHRLAMHGREDEVYAVSRAGAELARAAATETGALVAGCVGPTGELLEPLGTLNVEGATALFGESLQGLVDGGIDLVLIETMSDLTEAVAAIRASRQLAPGLPVMVTMSFDTNLRTMMGVTPRQAVEVLSEAGADAIGANCGRGPQDMEVIAAQLIDARAALSCDVLLLTQSNAGLPSLAGGEFVYTVGPEELARHNRTLLDLGIDLIGSCCGSTPEHTAAIVTAATPFPC